MTKGSVPRDGNFQATRWTLVCRARGEGNEAFRALSELCATYHYPLYCFARRQGLGPEDAEDATQAFFVSIMEKRLFTRADESRGRLRTFLLNGYQGSLSHRRQAATRQKRDFHATVRLDAEWDGEIRYRREPVTPDTPETFYHRAWAMQLLASSLARVQQIWAKDGNSAYFTALAPFLSGAWHTSANFSEVAADLGITVNAARQRACQLRRDYRKALLVEISETVENHDPVAVEEELRFLYRSVSRD